VSGGVVHCMEAPYDRYVGRGTDPRTGEPGEWENPYSHRPSRVPGVVVVATIEEALTCHERRLWNQLRTGRMPLPSLSARRSGVGAGNPAVATAKP
jgi:hypothetical protein